MAVSRLPGMAHIPQRYGGASVFFTRFPGSIPLVTVAQMRRLEEEADQQGHTYSHMMELAGRGVAEWVDNHAKRWLGEETGADSLTVLGLVGPGNNGGDTLVALAHLARSGWRAIAYLARQRGEGDELVSRLQQAQGMVLSRETQDLELHRLMELLESAHVVLDGLLGTGARPPLRSPYREILQQVRRKVLQLRVQRAGPPPLVVAVDVPSGVDCDTGAVEEESVIPADVTLTMAAVKMGMVQHPAIAYLGSELFVLDIGLPPTLSAWAGIQREVPTEERVQGLLPSRPRTAHKGTFGTVLVVGGSLRYTGAVYLTGLGAYYAGTGLVTLAVPEPLHPALAGVLPEATWLPLPHREGFLTAEAARMVQDLLAQGRVQAVVLGPGLGMNPDTLAFLDALLPRPGEEAAFSWPAVVVDADALKLLAQLPEWPRRLPWLAVLTPHPGEMAVLTGQTVAEIQRSRIPVAEQFAQQWGHVVVLKGAGTVVAAPDGRTGVLALATAALARAGTGDVLAGLIAGLRAQKLDAYEAALVGTWMHGEAGRLAEDHHGSSVTVLARDVLHALQEVWRQLGEGPIL